MPKKAMVLGLARSGIAATELLLERGWEVLACDSKERDAFKGALDAVEEKGAVLCLGERSPRST